MNKAELLATLNNTFYHVGAAQQVGAFGSLRRYTVQCFDQTGDIIRAVSVDFYVNNEGQPEEAAFWSIRQPASASQETFGGLVYAYIAARIADGTIESGQVSFMDEANETATAWVLITQQGQLNEKKVRFHRETPGGPITFTLVNTVVQTGG